VPAGPGRCAQCGAALPPVDLAAPRLILLCKDCRSEERPTVEALGIGVPRRSLLRVRWPARWVIRLLLFALLLCVFMIRIFWR